MSTITISPFGAYLTSWKIGNREVLYQGSELKRTGIPLLFPNFDAGAPLPNHGFGRVSEWQVIKKSTNSCHLRLTENNISPENRQFYPYKFTVDLKITAKANLLDYFLEVKNLSVKDLPLSPGLHPYWPIKHEQKSQIKLVNFPEFDPKIINWEQNPPNDLYDFNGQFIADFPDYRLIITDIKENHINNFDHLQIWSQNSTFPDHNFICFEPVTRPKNGINTNPITVSPNQTIKLHLQFQIILP